MIDLVIVGGGPAMAPRVRSRQPMQRMTLFASRIW